MVQVLEVRIDVFFVRDVKRDGCPIQRMAHGFANCRIRILVRRHTIGGMQVQRHVQPLDAGNRIANTRKVSRPPQRCQEPHDSIHDSSADIGGAAVPYLCVAPRQEALGIGEVAGIPRVARPTVLVP